MITQAFRIIYNKARRIASLAKSRQRLLQQQPSLKSNLPYDVMVDMTSQVGSRPLFAEGVTVFSSTLGERVNLGRNSEVSDSTLGSFTYLGNDVVVTASKLGDYSYITSQGFVQFTAIGKFCSIATNFTCGYGNHPTHMLSTNPIFYSLFTPVPGLSFADKSYYEEMPSTNIGHDVWIGANVFIKAGTTIGHGAIVAAGAVVLNDIAAYSVVGGIPAKTIRQRFNDDDVAILLDLQWWDWTAEMLGQAAPLIRQGDVSALREWFNKNTRSLHQSNS